MPNPERRAVALRAALLTLAALVLAYACLKPLPEASSARQAAGADARPVAGATRSSPVSGAAYGAIALHPVFEPSRQPWVPPKAAPSAPASSARILPPPQGYTLAGIIISAAHHAALIRDARGKTSIVSEGQTLDGWTVHSIDRAGLHLRSDQQHFDLTIRKQGI